MIEDVEYSNDNIEMTDDNIEIEIDNVEYSNDDAEYSNDNNEYSNDNNEYSNDNTEYSNDNQVSKSMVEKVAVKEEEIYEYEEDWQYTNENRYEDLKNEVSSYENEYFCDY